MASTKFISFFDIRSHQFIAISQYEMRDELSETIPGDSRNLKTVGLAIEAKLSGDISLVDPVERLHRLDVDPLIDGMEVSDQRTGDDGGDTLGGDEAGIAPTVALFENDRRPGKLGGDHLKEKVGRKFGGLGFDDRFNFNPWSQGIVNKGEHLPGGVRVGESNVEIGLGNRRDAVDRPVGTSEASDAASRMPFIIGGGEFLMKAFIEEDELLDKMFEGVVSQPGTGGVSAFAIAVKSEVKDALFMNGDSVERSAIGNKSGAAADSGFPEKMSDPVCPSDFLIACDGKAKGGVWFFPESLSKDLQHDGDRTFHIPGSRPDDPAIFDLATIDRGIDVGHDINVTHHENVRFRTGGRVGDEGRGAVVFDFPDLEIFEDVDVAANEVETTPLLVGFELGGSHEYQLTGQLDESFFNRGHSGGRFGGGKRVRRVARWRHKNRVRVKGTVLL